MIVTDPRTGEEASIDDYKAYLAELASARPPACKHDATALRLWTNEGGAKVVQPQCLSCGKRFGAQVKVPDRNAYPEADLTLDVEWFARDRHVRDSVVIRHIDLTVQGRDDWWARYNRHMASEAWRKTRTKVIKRCGGVCEGCAEAPAAQVHHLSYDHMGDELLFELVGLCVACHEKVHHHSTDGAAEAPEPKPTDDELDF